MQTGRAGKRAAVCNKSLDTHRTDAGNAVTDMHYTNSPRRFGQGEIAPNRQGWRTRRYSAVAQHIGRSCLDFSQGRAAGGDSKQRAVQMKTSNATGVCAQIA